MTIPKFTEKYLKDIGYPIVRNNIISEEDILLHFGIITKSRKIKAVKYDIVKPKALKEFLGSLRVDGGYINLTSFIRNIEMDDDEALKLKNFIEEHQEELVSSGILESKEKVKKVADLLRSFLYRESK